jgi:hypothetical protein
MPNGCKVALLMKKIISTLSMLFALNETKANKNYIMANNENRRGAIMPLFFRFVGG